ncbi:MAG TPA: hypothetical protein VH796_18855 [Nitrososphaeraceae archaeon]
MRSWLGTVSLWKLLKNLYKANAVRHLKTKQSQATMNKKELRLEIDAGKRKAVHQ